MSLLPDARLDPARHRYPYCVVWTPIPLITWLVPFIGHTGICTGTGVIHDFAGPYFVSEDAMGFGWPTKYWQLEPSKCRGVLAYDAAVVEANCEYKKRMHNLCFDNCHSHVARALNGAGYQNSTSWTMVSVAWNITLRGRYVSFGAFVRTWLPFAIIMALILGLRFGLQHTSS